MSPRKGLESVAESAERGGNFSGSGPRRYFKWATNEEKTLRFLTDGDDIVMANVHEYVQCHDGSRKSFVCRQEYDAECELCNSPDEKTQKRREIAYGVAIWREPAKKDGQPYFKTKTEEVEVEEDGKKIKKVVPWVGIVQQAPRNFWSWFWAVYQSKGTLRDREYTVRRVGTGKETDYQGIPEDKSELDFSKFEEYIPDLEGMLEFLGGQEYYDKWLHGVSSTKSAESTDAVSADVTEEDLEILKQANEAVAASAVSGDFD